eukprot:scaffold11123_cov28-Tisochrysis_lutea.AAC.3
MADKGVHLVERGLALRTGEQRLLRRSHLWTLKVRRPQHRKRDCTEAAGRLARALLPARRAKAEERCDCGQASRLP